MRGAWEKIKEKSARGGKVKPYSTETYTNFKLIKFSQQVLRFLTFQVQLEHFISLANFNHLLGEKETRMKLRAVDALFGILSSVPQRFSLSLLRTNLK
jgi:hypothetical protein